MYLHELNQDLQYKKAAGQAKMSFIGQSKRTRQELAIRWPQINLPRIKFFTVSAFPMF